MMLLRLDTIARTGDFDDRAAAMHLRPWQWLFLLAADGRTRLDDLARGCGIDFETAADLVHETEALGLIEVVTLTLEDYRGMHTTDAPASALPNFAAPMQAVEPIAAAPSVAPMKKTSVSFDALSAMFGDLAPAPAAAVEPAVHAEDAPIVFETPDHMVPLGQRASLYDAPAETEQAAHEASVAEAVSSESAQAPTKSVSFSLFATNFGSPEGQIEHEPAVAYVTHQEISTNGHAAIAESTHEPIVEHVVVHEPAHDYDDAATHEHVSDHAPEIARVSASTIPEDDVLLQHFNVGANGTSIDPLLQDTHARSKGDITSTLLRALGIKK